jgi:hypothetical protein
MHARRDGKRVLSEFDQVLMVGEEDHLGLV